MIVRGDRTNRAAPNAAVIFAFTLIVFVAFALRIWNLGTQSLWHDEGWAVFSGYNPYAPMGYRGADVNHPAVYYTYLAAWMRLTGDSVWAMRYGSVILGTLTVAAAGLVTRRLFGVQAGIVAAALVAVNPMLWVFSQEIRNYVAMPLYAVILLGLVATLFTRPAIRVWILIVLVEVLALYTHNLAVPMVAWLNVTVFGVFIARRDLRRAATWIASQAFALLLYLPWLVTQSPTGTPLNTQPAITPELVFAIWQSHFMGVKSMVNADPLLMVLIAVFGVLFVIALVNNSWDTFRRRFGALVASQALLLPVFELAIIYAARIDFHPRYFIVGVPAALMIVAIGTECLFRAPTLRLIPAVFAVTMAGLIGARALTLTFTSPLYQHDDFRAIAQHYATLDENDAIIVPYYWEPSLDYYQEKLGIRARFIDIPLHADPNTVIDTLYRELQGVDRVEVLTWYQLPADMRGMFSCILGAYSDSPPQSLTVAGIQTDGYTGISPRAADKRIDQHHFGALTLTNVQHILGLKYGCVVMDWKLEIQLGGIFRVALWSIANDARTDSLIRNNQQRPTSLWAEWGTGTSFALMERPTYLTATVYDERGIQPTNTFRLTPIAISMLALPVQIRTNARFSGLGDLYGVNVPDTLNPSESPIVTLVWHPESASEMAYTVFVHLLDDAGNIIAQSDSQPSGSARPTTSWVAGEYFTDIHTLTWQTTDYTGEVSLRIGLYNPNTMERVPLVDGGEFAVIQKFGTIR